MKIGRIALPLLAGLLMGCVSRTATVKVTIPPGSTLHDAADALARAGVIHGAPVFRVYAALRGGAGEIKPGTYALHPMATWETVLQDLRNGNGLIVTVTVPEGFTLTQIEHTLGTKLGVSDDSLRAAISDTTLLRELDVPTGTLEGYLFPDTYTFPRQETAREAVDAMVRRFEQVWKPEWTARLDSIPMSRNDLLTLASIVEKEAKLSEERPVIAAVYMNRLRDGMLLESDPTVQYALGGHEARVLDRQLKIDSPYNTYRYKGLPPGPIASPGRASIMAALYPAHVPFKFFVAFPDGHHEFRVDLADHLKAVAAARRARDSTAHRDTTRSARGRGQ